MKQLECIIIEDEFPASELLKGYLKEIPNWSVNSVFDNAIEATNYLTEHSVDVIFVDIKLPKLSGISFIRTLKKPPIIVITTAYSEHAIEAFELVVFDYLLKPYSFERFFKTVNRIHQSLIEEQGEVPARHKGDSPSITVNENRMRIKLPLDEIIYLESQKEYVQIECGDRTVKTKLGISKIAESLPTNRFVRIHRSFIVNIHKIDAYTKKKITINKEALPIGRHYQKDVHALLSNSSKRE